DGFINQRSSTWPTPQSSFHFNAPGSSLAMTAGATENDVRGEEATFAGRRDDDAGPLAASSHLFYREGQMRSAGPVVLGSLGAADKAGVVSTKERALRRGTLA